MADAQIVANTKRYAKTSIAQNVEKVANDKLRVEMIYVYDAPKTSWRAILIDSMTQAGKTFKCFDVLANKLEQLPVQNNLVLFVTQANSTTSAYQIIQRARASERLGSMIPAANIYRSGEAPSAVANDGNYMLVDFWNSRCTANMIDFVKATRDHWDNVVIVLDEVEQGGVTGVSTRLSFVRKVEKIISATAVVRVILITATVSNLSKAVLQLATSNKVKYGNGVVSQIIDQPVVEHYFAQPHETYVGPSWFKDAKCADNSPAWKRLVFPAKKADMTKEDYVAVKEVTVGKQLKALPSSAKELCLVVTSTMACDHTSLAARLYNSGFNVTVELNGGNNKNYKVGFINSAGGVSYWDIPYNAVEAQAQKGNLESFTYNRRIVETGIGGKEDITLPHMLQAALFMNTDADERIRENVEDYEYYKLSAIANVIATLSKTKRRPVDYPSSPRVAIVAGHLAGRGITIQNPYIDFACSSFCFTGTNDVTQRGATNSQRFGRACGMLKEIYTTEGRMPVLVATEEIMRDAVANEIAVKEKGATIEDGTVVSLKDLVTKEDWDRVIKKTKTILCGEKVVKQKVPIKKNGIIAAVNPATDVIVTKYKSFTIADFKKFYNILQDEVTVDSITTACNKEGIEAHVSVADISAKTVSDISNFYRNPSWCHKQYHFIIKKTCIVCIDRDVGTIKNVAVFAGEGKRIIAHTPSGTLQSYIMNA